jgi:enamine deaminase RidA (YjgF/YER057c/UK114 family)
MSHKLIQPEGWPRAKGYSNGVVAAGTQLYIAGQIGWGTDEKLVSDELAPQFEKALENVKAVLTAAGAKPEHLVRVTIYVTDKTVYRASTRTIGEAWRRVLGPVFPAMSLVQVADLLEDGALVEIEATAVLPG